MQVKIQKPNPSFLDAFIHNTFNLEEAELNMNCSADGSQSVCLQKWSMSRENL